MLELFGSSDRYWYSLISAAPIPENGERVNVALLIGNGYVSDLRFHAQLPRLRGIAAADEINVYRSILESIREQVRSKSMDPESVLSLLSPQLLLGEPRALLKVPDDALLGRLIDRFLSPPTQPAYQTNMDALVHKSVARLDEQIARARGKGVLIQDDVRPKNLYEGKLDRHVPFRVPKLARALRAIGRDVLLDSLVVENAHDPADIREASGRIGQAFYAYERKLKGLIRQYANREIRVIGVLQPGSPTDSPDTLALREYIKDTWVRDAQVIDGNDTDIETELRGAVDWVTAA